MLQSTLATSERTMPVLLLGACLLLASGARAQAAPEAPGAPAQPPAPATPAPPVAAVPDPNPPAAPSAPPPSTAPAVATPAAPGAAAPAAAPGAAPATTPPAAEAAAAAPAAAPVATPSPEGAPATAPQQPGPTEPSEPEPKEPPAEPPAPSQSEIPPASPLSVQSQLSTEGPALEEPGLGEDDREVNSPPWEAAITFGQSYNAAGLSRGGEQSFNPEYAWSFIAQLGYRFDKLTALRLRQPLTVELTDSDSTSTRQELWVLDTAVDLTRKLWSMNPDEHDGHGMGVSGTAGLVFPISPSSQAAHVILGTRLKAGFEYTNQHVLQGLIAGASLSYLRRWASSNVAHYDTGRPCIPGSGDIAESCTHGGGLTTTRDAVMLALSATVMPLDSLSVGASFSLGWSRGHDLRDETIAISTGTVEVPDDSPTHFRGTREIGLSVGYDFTPWFSASAGLSNGFSELGPDGQRRGPFHVVDTSFGLDLTLSIDQLYASRSPSTSGGQ